LANGTSNIDIATANGNVTVTVAGTHTWTFGSDGNVTIPGNIVGAATVAIDNRASGNTADINLYAADDITIQGRDRGAGSTSEGGDINIFAGNSAVDSDSSGGDILIFAGNGGNANVDFSGLGGFITIASGRGGNASTGVGNYPAEDGGELTLRAGDAGSNNGNILRGADGGFVYIEAGDSTGNTIDGGGINLTTGLGGANALAGNVEIYIPSSDLGAGGYWIFDGYGNLTLPTNGSLNLTGGGISQASDEDLLITTFDSDGIVSSSLLMSPGDTLTRLEQWSSQNSESFNTSDWSTGVYTNQGGLGAVQFTGAANIVDFVNSLNGVGHIFISVNGGPLLFLDGTGGGATDITFYTPTLPAVNPTTVTTFEYFYSYKSGFEIDYDSNEVNIYANDADIKLETTGQRDISLDSSGEVTITANSVSTWTFDNAGNLTLPSGGNLLFGSGVVSGTGNITSGNLDAVNLVINRISSDDSTFVNIEDGVNVNGDIAATGNVTGNYIFGNGSQLTDVTASVPSQTILPTVQTITVEARPAGLFGGGQGGANVTVANVIPVTEYGVIITDGTVSEKYKTGSLGSIPGTVSLTFTTGLNSAQFTVSAYVTSNAGTFYSNSATGTSGICLLAGTQIALSDGSHKAIEDITYLDKLLSWDFDRGCYAETTAMWIKRGETGSQYNLLTFSDGTTLRTFDQHRIFNKQAGAFTYPMTAATPVGTVTVNEHGQEIALTNKQVIADTIEYYNVITDYHMNLFSDTVLTSCRFNNIYPITDMKFVKDGRTLRPRAEFENIPDRFFHGLRLAEQQFDLDMIEWYVARLESSEITVDSAATV
jgi:hypothetical protein